MSKQAIVNLYNLRQIAGAEALGEDPQATVEWVNEVTPEVVLALIEALQWLMPAASDCLRNMREADGHCLDCGRPTGMPHDDPDCGMAVLEVGLRDARAALAVLTPSRGDIARCSR